MTTITHNLERSRLDDLLAPDQREIVSDCSDYRNHVYRTIPCATRIPDQIMRLTLRVEIE